MSEARQEARDTFPRLLRHHALARGDWPAMREKDLGIWQTWTWAQVADEVAALAAGLAELGFRRGEHLAIIGDNRPRLYWSMCAAQCLGGVPVPLYQDAVAQEMEFALNDAEIRFAVVEDQEQVDKLLAIKSLCPSLEIILFDDTRGLRRYADPILLSLDDIQAKGRALNERQPGFLDVEIAQGHPEDVSIMLYTSDTTGKPKGVCQTHRAFIESARGAVASDRLRPEDEILSYLPMAWVGDHRFSYAQAMFAGFTINCPESGDTVMTDLREIGPTYYFAPPRVFENLLNEVMIRMEGAGALKRGLFRYFMAVARRCGPAILDRQGGVSVLDRLLYGIGSLLIYAPLRNVLGMSRIRVAYTAGAAIGPDLFRFYRSIGINLKQLYGSTETCACVCLQPDRQIRFDSVGKPAPGVDVKIASNGEVLVKGPMLLKEYYRRPEATAESLDAEGYFRTGDAGFFDEDGQLRIIDRAKDVGRLANGAMFAPNYIENRLKFSPHIKEAVAFGHGRDRVCAFINIDIGSVGNWAERHGIPYGGYGDLATNPQVLDLIEECVEKVNAELARDALLADSQVHRFLVLHKELDPDEDELTRTRKVRRNFVAAKYALLVDALYSDKTSHYIETQVKFEDGRTGKVGADLAIRAARTLGPVRDAA